MRRRCKIVAQFHGLVACCTYDDDINVVLFQNSTFDVAQLFDNANAKMKNIRIELHASVEKERSTDIVESTIKKHEFCDGVESTASTSPGSSIGLGAGSSSQFLVEIDNDHYRRSVSIKIKRPRLLQQPIKPAMIPSFCD